ncbi:MAG: MFS transporter [Caulobacteraceae bacterium]
MVWPKPILRPGPARGRSPGAILQIGSVAGPAISLLISYFVLKAFLDMPPIHAAFGVIHGWQLIFIVVGLPGLLIALLMAFTMPEPARHTIPDQVAGFGGKPASFAAGLTSWFTDFGLALGYIGKHWKVFAPMFGSLFVGSLGAGAAAFMPMFYQRQFGWGPAQLAGLNVIPAFVLMPIGLFVGVWLAEFLARKGRDDAALLTQIIARLIALPGMFAVMMPNPWLVWGFGTLAMFSIGIGGPSQNAAFQIVTPTELRGKMTALYLFIYSVIGVAFSPVITGFISDFILHDESKLRWAIFVPALIFGPISLIITLLGLKPYEREVKRLKALEGR